MQDKLNEALALQRSGRLDDAERIYREILAAHPEHAAIMNNLANILKDSGRIEEAADLCRQALRLRPDDARINSSLCYKVHFHPDYDRRDLHDELKQFDARFGQRAPLKLKNIPGDRHIRIGYVSPDFYGHAECFFVFPLLKAHDRSRFEIHCYSSVRQADQVTEILKSQTECWHDVHDLNDDQLAQKINEDRIDILVDLSMHMAFNRLGVFAQKPAPIQFTWLAYPGSTGLTTIDYRLTDVYLDPAGDADEFSSERLFRLPDTWSCYDPLSSLRPAARRDGDSIVLGSLNNPCKLNRPTLALWEKVLQAVPNSTLLLLSESEHQRQKIRQLLGANRVDFVGRLRRGEYLRTYDRIDICLDPLVYNGITTTCDALWMGVPVITLPGQTAAGRAGMSILTNVGLQDLIAATEDQYIQVTCDLASDRARRSHLRTALRDQVVRSRMMNAPKFAREVENCYATAFGVWQAGFGNPI
jgi:predicted O-linked N-acetylglucosamine transferase (SPINDLY family)